MKKLELVIVLILLVAIMMVSANIVRTTNIFAKTDTEETTAEDGRTYLHQPVPINWNDHEFYESGDCTNDEEIPYLEGGDEVFWHFVVTYETTLVAYFEFEDSDNNVYDINVYPYKKLSSMSHYGIYTPRGYKLVNAYLEGELPLGNNGKEKYQFNLSHICYETQETTTTSETTKETSETTSETSSTTSETTKETSETTKGTTESTTEETTEGTTEGTTTEETTEETTSETTEGTTEETTETTAETTVETSETTETISTTSTEITTTTTEEIPQTGEKEDTMSIIIGFVLLALAGALSILLHKVKIRENS